MKKQISNILLIAVVYFVAARFGLALAYPGTNATPVWPATGIAIAAVLLLGYRIWPGIALGAFAVNLLLLTKLQLPETAALAVSFSTAIGNTLEALIAVLFIKHFVKSRHPFDRGLDVLKFIVFAVFISTTISATFGSISFNLGPGDWHDFFRVWLTLWLGDATGALLVTPVILTYNKEELTKWITFPHAFKNYLLLAFSLVASIFVFTISYPIFYLLIPALTFAAFFLDRFSSSAVLFVFSIFSIFISINYEGPFSIYTTHDSTLLKQGFIGCIAITNLVLSALIYNQKKTMFALQESEKYSKMLFNTSPIGLAVCEMDGRLVDVNQSYANIIGRTIEETLQLSYWDITPLSYSENEKVQLKSLNEAGFYGPYEKEYINRDGHLVPVRLQGTILEHNGNRFIWSTVEDISERIAKQQAMQENELKYRTLFESANDAIFIMDEKHFLDCNEYTLTLFGCTNKSEIVNHTPIEFSPKIQPDGRLSEEKARELIQKALEGTSQRFYWKHSRKDRSEFDTDVSLNRLKLSGGYFIQAIVRDISESLHARKKLQMSEERYRLISSVTSDYMFSSRINDDGILQLNWVAGAFESITGYTLEEYIEKGGWRATLHPEDLDQDSRDLEKLKRNQQVVTDLRTFAKNGELVWVRVYAQPIIEQPTQKLTGIYGAVQNITKQKLAEEEVRKINAELEQRIEQRTEQLLTLNKELEAFSYSISHDLRAPLRAVNGFTQILMDEYAINLDQEGNRICSLICEAAQDMGHLIDDLLSFSRLSRVELCTSAIDMKTLVNSVYYELTDEKMRSRVDFTNHIQKGCHGDPSMIRQVWMNLISNALKFSANRNKAKITVESKEENGYMRYTISDNGAGFDMKYANKLFGVFQRLHSTKEFEGNGVGLAIIQRIIHKHCGRVWATGKVDKGATFSFSLPML